jgi:hypothetical protein
MKNPAKHHEIRAAKEPAFISRLIMAGGRKRAEEIAQQRGCKFYRSSRDLPKVIEDLKAGHDVVVSYQGFIHGYRLPHGIGIVLDESFPDDAALRFQALARRDFLYLTEGIDPDDLVERMRPAPLEMDYKNSIGRFFQPGVSDPKYQTVDLSPEREEEILEAITSKALLPVIDPLAQPEPEAEVDQPEGDMDLGPR